MTTTVTQNAEPVPKEMEDLCAQVEWALKDRGLPTKPHSDHRVGLVSTCPVDRCKAALEAYPEYRGDAASWLLLQCEGGHEGSEIYAALDLLGPDVLLDDYGATYWFDLNEEEPDAAPSWAIEPLIEDGQFGSIYGPREVGKSLLALDYACQLARANSKASRRGGRKVLYLDHENPSGEILKRVKAMGYAPGDLNSLTYLSFPPIRALDTEDGAEAFLRLLNKTGARVVILDTWSKFIDGEEASPTTHTRAYNLAIVPARRGGITVLCLDHTGKDVNRGPRGGSSKGDNVDVEWLLTAKTGGRLRLERKKSRTGRGPDLVELTRLADPLRHVRAEQADVVLTAEARACVAKLDELEVSAGWGRDRVSEVLRANDYRVRTQTLAVALKVRRERGGAAADSLDLPSRSGNSREQVGLQDSGTGREQAAE